MGLLNQFFGSTEQLAREAEKDDEEIIQIWTHYHNTFNKKKILIDNLKVDYHLQKNLLDIEILLNLELADISDEEKNEADVISDLEAIEHDKKIKKGLSQN